jgi:flagellar basal-body rod protein FlgB
MMGEVMDMLWDDPVTKGLVKSLDVAALRQKVVAQNIANLNTPGYKRSYVVFSEELARARERLSLRLTHPRHIPGGEISGEPQVKVERSTSRRSDGNNVDLDQEMLDLVTNQLHYNMLAQKISERYATWRYIINEGRG